jgi:hypothetical protein
MIIMSQWRLQVTGSVTEIIRVTGLSMTFKVTVTVTTKFTIKVTIILEVTVMVTIKVTVAGQRSLVTVSFD